MQGRLRQIVEWYSVAEDRSPSLPFPGLIFAGSEPRYTSTMDAIQTGGKYVYGGSLSPVTHVNVEAQVDVKLDSNIGAVERSK